MSKALYSVDVVIYGTLYIKADSASEALSIARRQKGAEVSFEDSNGPPINGDPFDDPNLPDVSLSPVGTIYGPETTEVPSLVED